MSLYRLLLRSVRRPSTSTQPLSHFLRLTQNPVQNPHLCRSFAFTSAEEAAAERRRRKRRLRIEPPLHALRPSVNHSPPHRDPNAPRLPDSTSQLVGPRLNLHNRVQSLIRASDLDAASLLARSSVFSNTRPTVFTCNAIIAAMYRNKRFDEAIALFHFFFNQSDIVPNIVSYNNLINTHCDRGEVDTALEVYRHILANAPFSPSPVTYRHLTKGLIDAGRIGEAVDLLREMLNKGHGADSLVFNNLISGFLSLGDLQKANELFDELKERCLVYDGAVNATFMEWWFNQGKDKEAMESYKSWLDRKFRIIPATGNTLLEVLLKHGKKTEAWTLFEEMLDNHTPPNIQAVNSDTFNIMVNECFKLGKFEEAIQTFKKAGTKAGSKPFAMDVAGYNNIITRFCELGMLSEAEKLFVELCSKSLSPDVPTYRTMVDAYLKAERIDDALQTFTKMVESGLRVVASFGSRVFGELLKNGKNAESAWLLTKMGEKDPKPDALIYNVVVRGLCCAGEFDRSRDILDQMMRYAVGVTPVLQEFVRDAFGKVGRSEEIERVLNETRWASPRPAGPPRARPWGQLRQSPVESPQNQMAAQHASGPPQVARQQYVGSSHTPRVGGHQPSGPVQMTGRQPSMPSQLAGQQTWGSTQIGAKTAGQQSLASTEMATQTAGQQPWGSTQTAAQTSFGPMSRQQHFNPSHYPGQQHFSPSHYPGEQHFRPSHYHWQEPLGPDPIAGHESPMPQQHQSGNPLRAGQQPWEQPQMAGQQPWGHPQPSEVPQENGEDQSGAIDWQEKHQQIAVYK
ncbi:hypothetical protein SLEP1_g40290 [Rubroshorea leprosula]|uniref:Pentatricopeptide repeat-containing protein-mitochondrial domain-containing protein n=1 Tax=Rubroshorea leprosula TaxID=152421 RepID=A0AAV5L3T6_9ROSI|nr:hypothetical protein SLEP1_g40290 [Rubroshorea leprosula]